MINSELTWIHIRRKGRFALAGALFFLGIGVIVPQASWSPLAMPQENVVRLNVAVIERDAKAFGSLTSEEFTVYEDGVKQQIISLTAQESPFSLGIVIDASGSMRAQLPLIQKTALDVISRLSGADEAFVVAFKAESDLIQDFTSNQRDLTNAVNRIYTSGKTALLDSIVSTANHVHQKGKHRRKALLFITDGLDQSSSVKEDRVITTLLESQAQTYFICLPIQIQPKPSLFRKPLEPRKRLDRLAKASGGQSFYLNTADEPAAVAAKILGSMRRQYEITYASTNNKQDGKLRKVSIVVSPKDGRQLNVITRQGYYGPGDKRAAEKEAGKKKNDQDEATNCLAITSRCTSLVPSPIVHNLESRQYFSGG
ncbi:MAG: VWA domain-containing protein [Blastocatellia bacterium]